MKCASTLAHAPENYTRSERGAKLIKHQMTSLLSLDRAMFSQRPMFDAETGACRVQHPGVSYCKFLCISMSVLGIGGPSSSSYVHFFRFGGTPMQRAALGRNCSICPSHTLIWRLPPDVETFGGRRSMILCSFATPNFLDHLLSAQHG